MLTKDTDPHRTRADRCGLHYSIGTQRKNNVDSSHKNNANSYGNVLILILIETAATVLVDIILMEKKLFAI